MNTIGNKIGQQLLNIYGLDQTQSWDDIFVWGQSQDKIAGNSDFNQFESIFARI